MNSKLSFLKAFVERLGNYLNGTVDLKFLRHKFVVWGLIGLVALYLVIGGILGFKIYKVKSESTNIRRILAVYPLPAVLMPTDIILFKDYLNQLKYIRHFTEKTKKPLPPDDQLRPLLISQMIETRLLSHVTRKYNSNVTKADIDAAFNRISEANGGPAELEKILTDLYGMNKKEFRNLIKDQLLREKIQKNVLLQVQVKHILLRDEKKANELLDQLKKEPNKFEELAKAQSEDTANRDNGGDLGFVSRGVLVPLVEEVAFKLNNNQIGESVVKSEFGFHIIKVVDRKGNLDKSYQTFMDELRKGKKIWVLIK